jgi:predicted secreted hydrolase
MVYRTFLVMLVALALAACAGPTGQQTLPRARLSALQAVAGSGAAGFARTTEPRPFVFPQDHGPHQEYATEWWYYTGNLDTADGRHFGYQLTLFRFGLAPVAAERASDWATANMYMAHLAVADVAGGQFYAYDRFSRGAAGLAGVTAEPFRAWLEDWSVEGNGPTGLPMRLRAAQEPVAIDLVLEQGKPVVLQGDNGLSRKGYEPGNASYYYSLTRMGTRGTLRIGSETFEVGGLSWMDHEWSTSSLPQDLAGWDWFAIQLSDGRELMYFQLRHRDGMSDPLNGGTLVAADGTTRRLARDDVRLDALGAWQSPRSGTSYPAGWRLQVPMAGLDLQLTPYLADQELPLAIVYWEGAVKVTGTADGQPVTGNAYVELTEYGEGQDQGGIRIR